MIVWILEKASWLNPYILAFIAAFFIVVPHSPQKGTGHQGTERNSKKGEKGKGRVIVQDDSQSTDETEGINDQVRNPVQDSAGNIGSIGAPAGNQVSGVVICQGFPVGDQHFGKNVILDLGVHFKADEGRGIAGCLGNQNVGYGKTDHCGKGGQQLSGLVPVIMSTRSLEIRLETKRNAGACNSKQCIQDHGFPVTSAVLIDP